MKVDIKGNVLEVGDEVAYAQAGYTDLVKGYIVKLTPKGVKVARDTRAEGVYRPSTSVVKL